MNHFWPEDLQEDLPRPPLAVLRSAASELGAVTKGAVEASVSSEQIEYGVIGHYLYLVVPSINFKYQLLKLRHDTGLYPCFVTVPDIEGERGTPHQVESADELEADLKAVFAHPAVGRIVRGLLAQTQALSA